MTELVWAEPTFPDYPPTVANAVAEGHITVVPEVLVTGGGGGALDGLAATLMRTFGTGNGGAKGSPRAVVAAAVPAAVARGPEPPEEGAELHPSDA